MIYCIDTSVLIEYLILRYLANSASTELAEIRLDADSGELVRHLRAPNARRAFSNFLRTGPRFTTTSGVTVEVGRHARSKHRFCNVVFWNVAKAVYREHRMDEHLVVLDHMESIDLVSPGVVDESLIQLCLREQVKLLTADRRDLQRRARAQNVELVDLSELIACYSD